MCSPERVRAVRADEARGHLRRSDPCRLMALLDGLRLSSLVGRRLRELGEPLDPWLDAEIAARVAAGQERGRAHELVTLGILASLNHAGIRALGVKGAVLARQLYDDAGARTSADIDILVAEPDLGAAVDVLRSSGWQLDRPAWRGSELPILHETLTHETLPAVELHWRLHWYERRFARDALERAEQATPNEPLIMTPADGLAALTLFYARDGFSGLRQAADVATWWDRRCDGADPDALTDAVARQYPALADALWTGMSVLGRLVALPTQRPLAQRRRRIAAELARPFREVGTPHAGVDASLVDLLLAPPGDRRAAVRRELQKIPKGLERPLNRRDGLAPRLARGEHAVRVLRRWSVILAPAIGRVRRVPGRAPGYAEAGL